MSQVLVVGRAGRPWERSLIDAALRAGVEVIECESVVDVLLAVEFDPDRLVVVDESMPRLPVALPQVRSRAWVVVVGELPWADCSPADLDLEELLRTDAQQAVSRGPVIAVWGPQGSWGVSTIALELSRGMAHRPTVLIDANVHAPSIAQMLDLDEGGLLQACLAADRGAVELSVVTHRGLAVLTGVDPGLYPAVHAGALRQVVAAAGAQFERVVLDLDSAIDPAGEIGLVPDWTSATSLGLSIADHLLIVTGESPVALQRLWRALPIVANLSAAHKTVVVNRCESPRRTTKEVAARLADLLPGSALGWVSGPVTATTLAPILAEVTGSQNGAGIP